MGMLGGGVAATVGLATGAAGLAGAAAGLAAGVAGLVAAEIEVAVGMEAGWAVATAPSSLGLRFFASGSSELALEDPGPTLASLAALR